MSVLTNTMWNPGAEHATLGLASDSGCTVGRTNVAIYTRRVNLALNPLLGTLLGGNITGWTGLGSTLVNNTTEPYIIYNSTIGAGSVGASATLNIGSGPNDLKASTSYTFSADVFSYELSTSAAKRMMLYVAGSGVPVAATYVEPTGSASPHRISVTFTTGASGTVTIYAMNGVATVAGNNTVIAQGRVQVEETATFDALAPFFHGGTAAGGGYTYAWQGTVNSSAAYQQEPEGTFPKHGSYFYTLTSTGTAVARARVLDEHRGAAVAGERWWVGMKVRARKSNAAARNVRVGIRFYNIAPGATTGSTVGSDTFSSTLSLAPGAEGELWVTGVAGSGALSVSGLIERLATGATGDIIQIDDIAVIRYSDPVNPPAYFDGSYGNAYGWQSTVNLSPSLAYTPSLALTPLVDLDPVPRVIITLTDLYPTTETITLYRLAEGRQYRVRGALDLYAAGGVTVLDAEAPFGIISSYRAEMFTVAGVSLGFTGAFETTLAYEGTCIHQPTDPERAVFPGVLKKTAAEQSRPFKGELARASGRTLGVWIGSGRGGLEGLALEVHTATQEQQDALDLVFGGYDDDQIPVICLRTSLDLGLPRPVFLAVQRPVKIPIDHRWGGEQTRWNLAADEAAPPVEGIVLSLLTYADLEAAYANYAALEAAYLTYLAMESDYSLAGTA